MSYQEHTHHLFLVLLEVCVDKEAPGGVNDGVFNVVNTLIPAWGQRGGSRGYLVGVQESENQGEIVCTSKAVTIPFGTPPESLSKRRLIRHFKS